MAIKNKGVWDISIEINGKEVKNNFREVGKSVGKLRGELKGLTPGTDDFVKKSAQLKKAEKHFNKLKSEIYNNNSALSKLKKNFGGLMPLVAGAFSITAVLSFFKTITSKIGVLKELRSTLSWISGTQGAALDRVTARVESLSNAFDKDTQKMSESANNLAKQMNISFNEALDVIEKGFYDGADANGEFLAKVKEYPALLKEVGLNAEESIALMTQEIQQGIYSDKGIDTIKEANLRLREMPKSTEEALTAIGLSSETIQQEIINGSKTAFEVIQEVSERISTLPPQSKEVGQAIADVFGGPGEDAGYKYLSNLHNIELQTTSLINQTDEWSRAKRLEVEANEALNNVLVKLTGTGSTLSLIYNSFKLGLADLLSVITGVKDTAYEAVSAFDKQASAVISLDKNLLPLINEYETLTSKTNLTKEEQDRLKVVISKISGIVPTAITAFDEYGNALDISSEKAKEFIETQKILLRYQNAEVIEEQTDRLKELNKELEKNNSILNNRNEQGDIVKVNHTFTKTDKLIITEEKLSGAEISRIQVRQAEIQKLIKEHQTILDAHNGDYLEKAIQKQQYQTEKTHEQIEARKILETTAAKYRIKNIETLSDEQLEIEIKKAISRANILAGITEKESDAKAKAFVKAEEELNRILQQKRTERELAKKQGLEKEIATIEANYKKIEEKYAGHKDKLAELEFLKQQEIDDAVFLAKQKSIERLTLLEQEKYAEKTELEYEREIAKAESDEEKAFLQLLKIQEIADEELRIQELAELAKVEAVEGAEQLKAAIREKYALKRQRNDESFVKEKKKLDKETVKNEDIINKQRTQGYADMFGGIAYLLGRNTAAGKAAAIAQSTMNTYQGITEVWASESILPEPFATASKVISTATVLASGLSAVSSIKSTQTPSFFYGGSTGNHAIGYDQHGKVTGYVHANEWVAPEIMTSNPLYAHTFSYLEAERQRLTGYYYGGATSSNTFDTSIPPKLGVDDTATTSTLTNNTQIIDLLTRIAIAAEQGNVLVIGYDEARKIQDLQNELELSKKNGRLGS